MKLQSLLLGMGLAIAALPTLQAQKRPVVNPPFAFSYSNQLIPRRVSTAGDSTTIAFRLNAYNGYNIPSTTYLRTDKGAVLHLRSVRGFIRKEGRIISEETVRCDTSYSYYLGSWEDGNVRDSVVMTFDALPRGTKSFDYDEGYVDIPEEMLRRTFNIYDIRLDGRTFPSALPRVKPVTATTLPDFHPAWDECRLHIRWVGRLPEGAAPECGLFFWGGDTLGAQQGTMRSERTADGNTLTIRCCEPFTGGLTGANYRIVPCLVPGKDLTVYIDANALSRNAAHPGTVKPSDIYRFEGEYADLSEAISVWIDSISKTEVDYRYLSLIRKEQGAPGVERHRAVAYDMLREWRAKIDADRTLTPRQRRFLHLFAEDCYVRAMLSFRTFLTVNRNRQPIEHRSMYDYDSHYRTDDMAPDPHFSELELFRLTDLSGLIIYPARSDWYEYLKLNGVSSGRVFGWAKEKADALEMISHINALHPVSADSLALLPERYARSVVPLNDAARETLARLDSVGGELICEAPTPRPQQSMLQAIVDQYPGRVVVVDRWETWCGPCRAGMKAMHPLREELQGKDVVFIYIASGSSPMGTWQRDILSIGGKHYRLDEEQTRQLQLGNSVPQYFLFNQRGEQVFETVGFSQELVGTMRERINALLEKQ